MSYRLSKHMIVLVVQALYLLIVAMHTVNHELFLIRETNSTVVGYYSSLFKVVDSDTLMVSNGLSSLA